MKAFLTRHFSLDNGVVKSSLSETLRESESGIQVAYRPREDTEIDIPVDEAVRSCLEEES